MADFGVLPLGIDEKTLQRNVNRLRGDVSAEEALGEKTRDRLLQEKASGLNENEGRNGIDLYGNWLQRYYQDPSHSPTSWHRDDVQALIDNIASVKQKRISGIKRKSRGAGGTVKEETPEYEPGNVEQQAVQLDLFGGNTEELARGEAEAAHGDPDYFSHHRADIDASLRDAGVIDGVGRPSTVRGGAGQCRKQFAAQQRIDLTGKVARTPKRKAEIFSAYSHPLLEHFLVIYERPDATLDYTFPARAGMNRIYPLPCHGNRLFPAGRWSQPRPSRARGLKHSCAPRVVRGVAVAPFTGAWIVRRHGRQIGQAVPDQSADPKCDRQPRKIIQTASEHLTSIHATPNSADGVC